MDYWIHGMAVVFKRINDDNIVLIMEKGAHHLDLRAPNDADPPGVTKVRETERTMMENWIIEYIYSHKK